MAGSANSSSSRPTSPASRSRSWCCSRSSATTRAAPSCRPGSASIARSRCRQTSRKSRSIAVRRLSSSNDDLLSTSLQYLKGVGPRRAADLARAGLETVEDLLYRFPIRYEDRSRLQPIASLRPGHTASITGRILSCGLRTTRRPGFKIFEALVADGSGSIRATWLNQPFLRDVFSGGQHVVLFGAVEMRGHGGLQLTNPQYEIVEDEEGETIHTGRIVPVYEKAGSVTPKIQRRLVFDAIHRLSPELADPLPDALRLRLQLPGRYPALFATHFPPADAPLAALNNFSTAAQRRLIFEEAF